MEDRNSQDPIARPPRGFERFQEQVSRDAVLLAACVLLLALFRAVLLLTQRGEIAPSSGLADVAIALLNGLRYDGKIAAFVAMPSFLSSLACLGRDVSRVAERLRRIFGTAFIVATVTLCTIELFYFREYHAQFDHFVLGAVYDDIGAVLDTVWKAYPVLPGLLAIAALSFAGARLLRRALARTWIRGGRKARGVLFRTGSVTIAILLYAVVLRGSTTSRPVQEQDAAVTRDPFLNELVPNPYSALSYALKDWRELESAAGLRVHLADGDVRAAAVRFAGPGKEPRNVDDALLRRAPGRGLAGLPAGMLSGVNAQVPTGLPEDPASRPRHLFLVVTESYDAWTLEERWADLHLAEEMKALGREGILLKRFVSASSGTMSTLSAIVTGLADAGVYTNYQASATKPYSSSIAPIFARLGYRTRVFYGGYLSWQRVGEFCRAQGFDEVYGAAHMGAWTHTNAWGVNDEELFDFVDRTVQDDVPSFDLVLSTSNHPPYDIDVWAAGWPVREIPPGMEAGFEESGASLRELGHHAYADRAMGGFVRRTAGRLPSAVFAVTGDHYSRKFPGTRPTLYERTAVPLLLYGKAALAGRRLPLGCVGSHHDIVPTLVELAAPQGFEYHAIGRSLFDPERRALGIGPLGRVIGSDWIADFRRGLSWEWLPWTTGVVDEPGRHAPDGPDSTEEPDPMRSPDGLDAARRLRGDVLGLSWWRIRRGPNWNAPQSGPQ